MNNSYAILEMLKMQLPYTLGYLFLTFTLLNILCLYFKFASIELLAISFALLFINALIYGAVLLAVLIHPYNKSEEY